MSTKFVQNRIIIKKKYFIIYNKNGDILVRFKPSNILISNSSCVSYRHVERCCSIGKLISGWNILKCRTKTNCCFAELMGNYSQTVILAGILFLFREFYLDYVLFKSLTNKCGRLGFLNVIIHVRGSQRIVQGLADSADKLSNKQQNLWGKISFAQLTFGSTLTWNRRWC